MEIEGFGRFVFFSLLATQSALGQMTPSSTEILDPRLDWNRGQRIFQKMNELTQAGLLEGLADNHFHADLGRGMVSLNLLWGWIQEDTPTLYASFDDFRRAHTMLYPAPADGSGLGHFIFDVIPIYARTIGKNPSRVEKWFQTQVTEASRDGITYLSMRFSPGWLTLENPSVSWDQILQSVLSGIKSGIEEVNQSGRSIQTQLILITTREIADTQNLKKNIDFLLKNRKYFVGFDIAGDEAGMPMEKMSEAMKPLLVAMEEDPDLHVTIHAGEAAGVESIEDAIEFGGAERIGHGIAIANDLENMTHKYSKLMIENSPTSNLLITGLTSYCDHPLPLILRQGLGVSLNTDDPAVFLVAYRDLKGRHQLGPVSLRWEYAAATTPIDEGGMGLSLEEMNKVIANGVKQFELFQPKTRASLNEVLLGTK